MSQRKLSTVGVVAAPIFSNCLKRYLIWALVLPKVHLGSLHNQSDAFRLRFFASAEERWRWWVEDPKARC